MYLMPLNGTFKMVKMLILLGTFYHSLKKLVVDLTPCKSVLSEKLTHHQGFLKKDISYIRCKCLFGLHTDQSD